MLSTEEGAEFLQKLTGDPRERARAVERMFRALRNLVDGVQKQSDETRTVKN